MAHISLILLEDVENLGLAGEEVHVTPGFAELLLPRKLAAKSTPATLRMIASRKEKIEAQRAADLADAQALAAKLKDLELSIPMQAAADDQLYGAVTNRVIAEKLAASGFAIDHSRVKLETPIKLLGTYEVEIRLHPTLTVPVKVWVIRG